ncbi:MAG: hypothetical protein JNK10_13755 [Cyclobacteriaceae bacterium]|nr:hypothetical protein [Cyclobacteriaceae bacterium]
MDFELMSDNNGTWIIHYTQVISTSPRSLKSNFIVHSKEGTNKVTVPLDVDIERFLITDNHFIFLVRPYKSRNLLSKLMVVKINKAGDKLEGTSQIELGKEFGQVSISKGPNCYMMTELGKGEVIRIRDLADFSTKTVDLSIDLSPLAAWGKSSAPLKYSGAVFFQGKNLALLRRYYKESLGQVTNKLILYEVEWEEVPQLRSREIPNVPQGGMDFYVFGNRLFYYLGTDKTAELDILKLENFETVKSFSSDDDKSGILDGKFYKGLVPEEVGPSKVETKEKKLKFLNAHFPWVAVAASIPGKAIITYGSSASFATQYGSRMEYHYTMKSLDLENYDWTTFEASNKQNFQVRMEELKKQVIIKANNEKLQFATEGNKNLLSFDKKSRSFAVWQ